jgi:hypothetical protein
VSCPSGPKLQAATYGPCAIKDATGLLRGAAELSSAFAALGKARVDFFALAVPTASVTLAPDAQGTLVEPGACALDSVNQARPSVRVAETAGGSLAGRVTQVQGVCESDYSATFYAAGSKVTSP